MDGHGTQAILDRLAVQEREVAARRHRRRLPFALLALLALALAPGLALGASFVGGTPPVANAAPPGVKLNPGADLVFLVVPGEGFAETSSVGANRVGGWVSFNTSTAGQHNVMIPLSAPASLYGVNYGVKSVRICYLVQAGTINTTRLIYVREGDFPALPPGDQIVRSNGQGCYTLTEPTLVAMPGAPALELVLERSASNFNLIVTIKSITLTLSPIP